MENYDEDENLFWKNSGKDVEVEEVGKATETTKVYEKKPVYVVEVDNGGQRKTSESEKSVTGLENEAYSSDDN